MSDENRFGVAHRLRAAVHNPTMNRTHTVSDSLINEAADEIERLRAALEELIAVAEDTALAENTGMMDFAIIDARTVLDTLRDVS